MKLQLAVPSKTFLVGEYSALYGGPALVLNTQPCFTLIANNTLKPTPVIVENIHQESPAGKFLLHFAEDFKKYHIVFSDPHHGQGGFGASTAQFLMVWLLKKLIAQNTIALSCAVPELLKDYWEFAWSGEGTKPSGADIVGQTQGHISYYYPEKGRLQTLKKWPFPNLNYYLLRTGNKIVTHEHLKEITSFKTHQLMDIVFASLQHLQTCNATGFASAVNQYADALEKMGLIHPESLALLNKIKKRNEVVAAKGCGALGADVILVLVEKQDQDVFLMWLQQQNLSVVSIGHSIEAGVRMTLSPEVVL